MGRKLSGGALLMPDQRRAKPTWDPNLRELRLASWSSSGFVSLLAPSDAETLLDFDDEQYPS